METWNEITDRHREERRALEKSQALARRELRQRQHEQRMIVVENLAVRERLTQTEAASSLQTSLACLNNFIHRNGIHWPVKRQGQRATQ